MTARTRRIASTRRSSPPERDASSSALSSPAPDAAQSPPVGAGLQFSEPLSWRAGRPIPVAELLRRLQALGNELHDMEQEEDETVKSSFNTVAKELADPQLLGHKDRGVRAWVACCAVDVLRLCAPNAPFTEKQLGVSYISS